MKHVRRSLVIALCALLAGCWEFLEPEFATENAATVMQVNANITEQGSLFLTGLLVPGLDDDGFVREVVRDTLYVFGIPFASTATTPTGARVYNVSMQLNPQVLTQPFTIDPPVVSGVSTGPRVRWASARPIDPDTIRIAPGADLLIRIAYDSTGSDPRPSHQWFFEMTNNRELFQIGSNTPPPPQLLVPASWIPQPADSSVRAVFRAFQSAQVFQNDYRGVYSYTVQFDHTIIIR